MCEARKKDVTDLDRIKSKNSYKDLVRMVTCHEWSFIIVVMSTLF